MTAATIIMPTFNHGGTIRFAVDSVRAQTLTNFELFIVGDGVPEDCKPLIRALEAEDGRIRFFDFPKHERRGEPNRHEVLQQATGRIVCYLCDRDLWLPDHLARMDRMLQDADFAHALSMHVLPEGRYRFFAVDLARPIYRRIMLEQGNRVSFSSVAHTLEIYRKLPEGWTTTPAGVATDWYMFRKFLALETCRAVSGTYPSAITFPSPPRLSWAEAERIAELEQWVDRVATSAGREAVVVDLLQRAVAAHNEGMQGVLSRHYAVERLVNAVPGGANILRRILRRNNGT